MGGLFIAPAVSAACGASKNARHGPLCMSQHFACTVAHSLKLIGGGVRVQDWLHVVVWLAFVRVPLPMRLHDAYTCVYTSWGIAADNVAGAAQAPLRPGAR